MRMSLLDLKHLKQVKDKEHKSTLPYKQMRTCKEQDTWSKIVCKISEAGEHVGHEASKTREHVRHETHEAREHVWYEVLVARGTWGTRACGAREHEESTCLEVSFNSKSFLNNFFKKRLQHRCFPVKLAKFLRTPILNNICQRLLLSFLFSSVIHCRWLKFWKKIIFFSLVRSVKFSYIVNLWFEKRTLPN